MWRNGMMTLASITVLLSCLIVMGCFSMLLFNIDKNLDAVDNMNEIVVFVYSDKEYKDGDVRTLPSDLESDGNTFLGWSTDPDASEPTYVPGQKYTVTSADAVAGQIRFYAVWENKADRSDVSVKYNTLGVALTEAVLPDENTYSVGSTVELQKAPTAKNPANTFLGWSLSADGSTGTITSGRYIIGEDDVKGGNVTFYAIWSQMPVYTSFEIVYDSNGIQVASLPTDAKLKLEHVEEQIKQLSNIAEDGVRFVSKEETLKEEKEKYNDYPGLQSFLSEDNNPFPDTFIVTYLDNSKVNTLELQIKSIDGVDKVRCRADIAETIESLKNGIIIVFSWFMIILFVVSIFVIINTVKLAVVYRSKEITIMRYIGATKWFIALPFYLEGIIIGIFSGLIAFFVQWFVYGYVHKMLVADLAMITVVPFSEIGLILMLGCLIVGVLTGMVGSAISIRKYLKA